MIAEARKEDILIHPAKVVSVEVYTSDRRAQFLLSSAIGAEDYAAAVSEVRAMGLALETILHDKPPGA